MIEVGDMIIYGALSQGDCENDIGWVVHTEKHHREDGLTNLIYIKWLLEKSVDSVWQHALEAYDEFTLVEGGQYG